MDERMERLGLFYVRFMDDIVVLAPTRWKPRQAIKLVSETLGELRLEKRPPSPLLRAGRQESLS